MAETNPTALVAPAAVDASAAKTLPEPQTRHSTTDETPRLPSTGTPSSQAGTSPSAAYPVFVIPATLPQPPFVDISGIPNFRCIGGYLSANGATIVRPNLFYRCAHPAQITPQGLEQLTTGLGVKAIYDLRSSPEVARTTAGVAAAAANAHAASSNGDTNHGTTPSAPPVPQIPYTSLLFQSLRHFTPVYATEDTGPEALAKKLSWYTAQHIPTILPYPYSEGFVNAYRDIATHGVSAYTTIFRHILTRPQDPLVFHCTAGKDRTGVLAALMLRLAGVDDETICWEYAVTEPGLGEWRTLFIKRMSAGAGLHGVAAAARSGVNGSAPESRPDDKPRSESMTREDAARVVGSRAGNMRAWLTLVVDGEFGGAERYLLEKCHFTDDEVTTIKRNLVVDLALVGEQAVVRPCAIERWTPDGGCVD